MRAISPFLQTYHLTNNRIRTICPERQEKIRAFRQVWSLPQKYRDELVQYYIRKWQGSWLAQQLAQTNAGNIVHNDVIYKVEYHNCHPVDACAAKEVWLSFRQVRHDFYCVNYVLISVAKEKE